MKHRLNILRLCILLLAGVMHVGCAKDTDSGTLNDGMAEITFTVATATDKTGTTRTGEAAVPKGTAFCVVVYKAGEAPATATPVATGVYSTIDDTGNASAQTATDRILLYSGSYDFYFVAPTAAPTAGIVTVQNGDEVLTTGKQTINVQPDADGKCPISILFARRSSMLDIVVYYKTDDGPTTSVTIPADKTLLVSGLFASADVPLDGSAVTSTGTTGAGTLTGDKLKETTEPAGVNTKGFSTFTDGTHRGLHVLPGTIDLGVVVPVTINGSVSRNMQAEIAHVKLEEGKYYTLKVQVSLTAPVVATIEEWVPSTGNGEELMGFYQAANCYISYPEGGSMHPIKFDATKKPRTAMKGMEGQIAHQGYISGYESGTSNYYTEGVYPASGVPARLQNAQLTTDLLPSEIDRIEVVWQTMIEHGKHLINETGGFKNPNINFKTDINLSGADAPYAFIQSINYDNVTGNAIVRVNGTGNALIAAYSADNTILWSWHIWGTDSKPQASINNSVVGDVKFMDRNLGALSATATQPTEADAYKHFGLSYQWGRKEPFTGAGPQYTTTLGADNNSIPTAIFDKSGKWMQSASPNETANSQPKTLTAGGYTYNDGSATSTYALLTTPTLFYSTAAGLITNSPNTWVPYSDNTSKSIYDPCPYGYRVPKRSNWNTTEWAMSSTWEQYQINGGGVWKESWFPAAGGRRYDGVYSYNIGNIGTYWSSSRNASYNNVSCAMSMNKNNATIVDSHNRCNGFSIRCVEDK